MRTIVRCAILAPALAFTLPALRAEEKSEEKSAPVKPPRNDSPGVPDAAPTAKSIPFFLSKTTAAPPSSSPASDVKTAPTNPEFSASIRRSFPYVPATEPAANDVPVDGTLPVVEMKPFHVATDRIVERATKGMEERQQKEVEKAFNVKDGGRFGKIGPAEIGLKFDPKHKGWDILSIPW